MAQDETNPRFDVEQTAILLGIGKQAVFDAIWNGRLKVRDDDTLTVGTRKYRLIRLEEIDRYRTKVQDKEPVGDRWEEYLNQDKNEENIEGRHEQLVAV